MRTAVPRLIHALFGRLAPAGLVWAYIGAAAVVVAGLMSYDFGANLTVKHGVSLACLTLVAALIPMVAEKQWGEGRKGVAVALAVIAAPLLTIEFMSHAGYAAGFRGKDVAEATVQKVKWTGAQNATKQEAENLNMWRGQLAALTKERTDLVAANPWAPTVKASGLKAELETLNERMAAEERGQRGRKAGRGREFEALQNQANDLAKRISTAEKLNEFGEQIAKLSSQIEATQRILDRKTEVAGKTQHGSSAVQHQQGFFSQAYSLAKHGDMNHAEGAADASELVLAFAIALIGTGVPALAFFVAGLYRIRDDHADTHATEPREVTPAMGTTNRPADNIYVVQDDQAQRLRDAIREAAGNTIGKYARARAA